MDSRIADVLVWCIWSSNFEVRNWSNWTDCAADCEFIIAVVDLRWLHATAESSDTGLAKSKRSPDVPGLPKSTSTMYKKNQMGKALEMKKSLRNGKLWEILELNTMWTQSTSRVVSTCLTFKWLITCTGAIRQDCSRPHGDLFKVPGFSSAIFWEISPFVSFCLRLWDDSKQFGKFEISSFQLFENFEPATMSRPRKRFLTSESNPIKPLSGPLTPYCGNGRVESWEDAISHLWFWIQMVSKSRLHKSSSVMDSFNDMPICPMAPETLGTTARPRSTLEKIPTDLCEC